ncbi:MAG: hypothetical protein ACLFMO_07990 [Eubacteriales bacterium]
MEIEFFNEELITVLENKIIDAIEYIYFSTSKQRKMLLDFGVYERDIKK